MRRRDRLELARRARIELVFGAENNEGETVSSLPGELESSSLSERIIQYMLKHSRLSRSRWNREPPTIISPPIPSPHKNAHKLGAQRSVAT